MANIKIERSLLGSPVAIALIGALNAELTERYPEVGANHFRLDDDEVAPGRGSFLVAYLEDESVGCGAVRRLDGREAEIKRMYVAATARRNGIGRVLLAALEAEARKLGANRLVLETGVRQPKAIGLYTGAGFARISPFGEYVGSPLSVCMAKNLD